MEQWLESQGLLPVTQVWGSSTALAMALATAAAVYVLATEPRMRARTRTRWTLLVAFTTLLGGSLFVVRRWRDERMV